jgi:hypothetical protein
MKYDFKFLVEVVETDGSSQAAIGVPRPQGLTSLTLTVNAENLDNAKVKAQRAIQGACMLGDPHIYYTHDR